MSSKPCKPPARMPAEGGNEWNRFPLTSRVQRVTYRGCRHSCQPAKCVCGFFLQSSRLFRASALRRRSNKESCEQWTLWIMNNYQRKRVSRGERGEKEAVKNGDFWYYVSLLPFVVHKLLYGNTLKLVGHWWRLIIALLLFVIILSKPMTSFEWQMTPHPHQREYKFTTDFQRIYLQTLSSYFLFSFFLGSTLCLVWKTVERCLWLSNMFLPGAVQGFASL